MKKLVLSDLHETLGGKMVEFAGYKMPVQYADGVKIRISNIGYVFYKNVKLPMIARISMDLMIVDVTKVKNIIKIGDYLEVFGKNLNLDSFARVSDTSPYDIITSVSERCERIYIN